MLGLVIFAPVAVDENELAVGGAHDVDHAAVNGKLGSASLS
jgi:hypothetical protein